MSKKTHMGYPGVFPSPDDQSRPEGETVRVVSEDAANALIQDKDGQTRVVPKSWLRRS